MKLPKVLFLFLVSYFAVAVYSLERKPHPCPPTLRSDGYRVGHLEQLGCQRTPVAPVKEYLDIPTPRELWENHAKPYKPAVLRNALINSPALSLWTDEYLIETYGDQDVLIEKKYEDRKSEPKRMDIRDFLANYHKENWYVVSMLPNAMRKDIKVPKPLICSTFRKNLAELNLWIGTNGTRSMLHYDADNIMHCVVSGLKDWILIHPENAPKLDMVVNRQGQNSGFSHLDVDRIDEDINPEVWDVPWQYVTLRGGDCLFLPYQYMHQVRSYDRTISATFLSYPYEDFSDEDCKGVNYDEYLSLKDVYVHWTHEKGQDTVDMGYMNPNWVQQEMVKILKVLRKSKMDMKLFLYINFVQHGESVFEAGEQALLTLFEKIDADGDGSISLQEMENADTEGVKEYCRKVENPHGPTKSSLPLNKKYSSKTSDFAPRINDRHIDSYYASIFMNFVFRLKGENAQITYPEFKKIIEVKDGSITDAFIIFDRDFDGVLNAEEVNNTTQKSFRKFSKMRYGIKGTSIQGGGKYAEEVEGRDLTYLIKLNKIPKEKMITSDMDDKLKETARMELELREILTELKKIFQTDGKIDAETFKTAANSFKIAVSNDQDFDPDIIFTILDNGDKGYISIADLDFFISNTGMMTDENQGKTVEVPDPLEFLGRAILDMEQVMEFHNGLEYYIRKLKTGKSNDKKEPKLDRSEL